jgi:hypothetical protein
VDQDIGAFKVKKTKLSRQMSAQKAPVAMPRRGGLGSTSSNQADGVARRAWKEGETDDVSARVSEDDPMEDNIVSITDDAEQITGGDDAGSGSEPDAQTGAAARVARARRAAAREIYGNAADAGGVPDHQADYIPMVRTTPSKLAEDMRTHGSREAGSPFEPSTEASLRALVPASFVDANADAEGGDDWAMQQMRIGAHKRHGSFPQPELADLDGGYVKPSDRGAVPLPPSKRATPKFGAGAAQKVLAPAQAIATLWETMQQLEGSVGERTKRDKELESKREEAVDELAKVEGKVSGLDKNLRVVQELEEFAWGIGGLLDAKVPKLNQAVKTLAQMEQEFTSKRYARRIRDIADDVCGAGASLTIPLAEDDEDREPQVAAKLAERRLARKKRRRERMEAAKDAAREGWETSSMSEEDAPEELANDRAAFCAAVHKQILGDVIEGFSVANFVLRPIRKAKQQLKDEYSKAYVPNSLPEVLALYVDHSLLWWDPLEVCFQHSGANGKAKAQSNWGPSNPITSHQFEEFAWFEDLAAFTELMGDDDPDGELVPKLMQRCLFPEVLRRIRDCWDVSSLRHSERIMALLDECLLFETDESASAYAEMLEGAARRLEDGLAALAPEVFVPNEALSKWYGSAARLRLLWRSCKVARCAIVFDKRLPDERLLRLVLSSIFATRIAPHLRAPRTDMAELTLIEQFISALPARWLESGLPPALVPLRDALGPRAPKSKEASHTAEAAARILTLMGCHDEAQVIRSGL